ncbi:MAG: 50S ribosomal protein L21 [Phycisphaerales bacterium]
MYAIIEDSGTQIRVAKGDELELDLRDLKDGTKELVFDRVLAVGQGDGTPAKVGTPYLAGAKVTAEVVGETQGDKLRLAKYKRRKGYRRTKGHRQSYLKVRILSIAG